MNLRLFFTYISLLILGACTTNTVEIKNEKKGVLKATFKLELDDTKRITLDSVTAPKPRYTQLFVDSTGTRYFTFLNNYANSIYFYNYNTLEFSQKILYNRQGPHGIPRFDGYHIKNMDSIYLYNRALTEIVLSNRKSRMFHKISLRGNGKPTTWFLYYPQYYPQTATPFIETNKKLLFTGQYFLSIPDSMITRFKFDAQVDFKSNKVDFIHSYPKQLFGSGYNWEGGLSTTVFPELHPDKDKLIYSFPVSHDLYIADIYSDNFRKVYAGSNSAGTISSIDCDPPKTSAEISIIHYIQQDMYAAIKYDKYRKVYYRFLRKGIPNTTLRTLKEEKPIVVIIMDENFNYLGETVIGICKDWHWQNSFVTQEGLNIEYIEKDYEESYLTLKIFTLNKI